MVVPIIIGIGVTIAALSAKATLTAYSKYLRLTPTMIARMNGIRIVSETSNSSSVRDQILRDQFKRYPGGFDMKMTEQEALRILGIEGEDIDRLDAKLLKSKHRKLMILNHPDKSGSPYLAMKINQAKDILENSYLFKK